MRIEPASKLVSFFFQIQSAWVFLQVHANQGLHRSSSNSFALTSSLRSIIMGAGASSQSEWTNSFFVNPLLLDGCTYLCGDDTFRSIFIRYIKTGEWEGRLKDMLATDKLNGNKSQNGSCDFDARWLGYAMAESAYEDITAEPATPKRQISVRGRSGVYHMHSERSFATNGSFNVSSLIESNLSQTQISSLMLSILYPLFASTDDDEQKSSPVPSPARKIARLDSFQLVNPDATRAQKILQTSADLYTDPDLQLVLKSPAWLQTCSQTLKDLSLGITVSDTSKPGCPIVYANTAFKYMSGYRRVELEGKSFADLLHGPSTEPSQVALIEDAVRAGRTAKVAVTFHSKRQRAFLDLVAVRASAQYSVAVHFAATKFSKEEELQMVDDLLLLLACIIKAPLHHPAAAAADTTTHRAAATRNNSVAFGSSISRRFGRSSGSVSARFFSSSKPSDRSRSPSPDRLHSRESSGVSAEKEKEKEKAPSRGQSLRHVSRMLSRPFSNSDKRSSPVVML